MAHTPPSDRGCPNEDELAAFLRSELPPAECESIRSHVVVCPACDSRIGSSLPSSNPIRPALQSREFHAGTPGELSTSGLSLLVSAQPQELAELPQIGQYQLVQEIGKGGMGVVYRAKHLRLKRWVALKLLSDWSINAYTVARFEREMEIIGRLDHPNIVRAHDAGYADGYHYLAMELIDGSNLLQIARDQSELSVANACEMIRQAAVGLNHACDNGLIHRDIKPNNLMLSTSGVVKVLDLGLARHSLSESSDCLTATGAIMGTPDYMAPEQWDACHDVDIRADIYSLGCTLHTLLAKQPPFSGPGLDSTSRKRAAHLQTPPPRLGDVRLDVPSGVQAIIDRAMAKDPDGRFQRPIEFAEALAEFTHEANLPALAQITRSLVRTTGGPLVRPKPDSASSASQLNAETVGPAPVVSNGSRRVRMRVWLAAAILVIAGIAAVAFSGRLRTDGHPELPGPEPKAELKPKPNEWFDLLAAEPTKAVWPQGRAGTESAWKYDGAKRELWVHAIQRVMIKLAVIEDVDFELELTISQHPWRGNIGVYFADRTVGEHHRADLLALDGFDFTKGKPTVPLVRGRIDHEDSQFKGSVNDYTVGVPRPNTPDYKLWLTAYRNGQILVQCEGQSRAVSLRPPNDSTARGTAGAIGINVEDSTSVVRQARLKVITHNP